MVASASAPSMVHPVAIDGDPSGACAVVSCAPKATVAVCVPPSRPAAPEPDAVGASPGTSPIEIAAPEIWRGAMVIVAPVPESVADAAPSATWPVTGTGAAKRALVAVPSRVACGAHGDDASSGQLTSTVPVSVVTARSRPMGSDVSGSMSRDSVSCPPETEPEPARASSAPVAGAHPPAPSANSRCGARGAGGGSTREHDGSGPGSDDEVTGPAAPVGVQARSASSSVAPAPSALGWPRAALVA